MAKWIENLGTGTLGSKDVIRRMTTPYVLANGDTTNYGFGLFLDEHRGLRRVQHGGRDVGYRAMLLYYPEIDAGAVAMSNNGTFALDLPGKVAETFLGEHMNEEDEIGEEGKDGAFDPEEV
ncbi:MAG: serine hydrolase [Balneolaceae bacterium]|nr:serine hydrolase [Balneolaceae bacterium]